MNYKEVCEIPITDYLSALGVFSSTINKTDAWYCSPIRKENTPSFHVNLYKNNWYDHGIGQGGNILTLVMMMSNISVNEALVKIENYRSSSSYLSPVRKPSKAKLKSAITILDLSQIQNQNIINYLKKRKIPLSLARLYLQEVVFSIKDNRYTGIALRNDKGGYEIRTPHLKTSTSPKFLTTIDGSGMQCINIFEGVFDFLSALVYFKRERPNQQTIILNSLSFIKDVIPFIKNYSRLNLFLDNDHAGTMATERLCSNHFDTYNQSQIIHQDFKDFNEFLVGINQH